MTKKDSSSSTNAGLNSPQRSLICGRALIVDLWSDTDVLKYQLFVFAVYWDFLCIHLFLFVLQKETKIAIYYTLNKHKFHLTYGIYETILIKLCFKWLFWKITASEPFWPHVQWPTLSIFQDLHNPKQTIHATVSQTTVANSECHHLSMWAFIKANW